MGNEVIELENGFTRHKSAVGSEISTAKTKMTANELKVFYQVSTLVDKDDDEFMKYTISVKDFIKSFPTFSQTNIKSTRELCRALAKQTFEIENPINGNWEIYTIFSSFKFDNKAQTITMSFNEEMRPYLLTLKQFTKIENVEYIKQIESKYAIRIYALLKDYRKMTYRDFDMEALHKILQSPKTYIQDFGKFREKVLTPAVKEINKKSDLYISKIEEIKKERKKVLKIRIHFGLQSRKVADDTLNYLIEYYNQTKNIRCFVGAKFMLEGWNEPSNITSIEVEQEGNKVIYSLYCNNSDMRSLMYVNEKIDFLNEVCKGIHRAIEYHCDNLKKISLDLELWQDNQDKIKYYKNVVKFWVDSFKQKR